MRSLMLLPLVGLAIVAATPSLGLGSNGVQDLVEAGEIMPLEPIRNRVLSQTRGEFVGVEFDSASKRYRFRFLVEGALVNVDVDARTGRRITTRQSY